MYTASTALFEALWEAGVRNVFVNLGSDHPSIMEAMVTGQTEKRDSFPKIYTCPNEMVALSMADGYARRTGRIQAVIVHVDVGTQSLAQAMHNASCGRVPVLIFAGLSPYTLEGEYRGSRTEYIHWIQDVPDQRQIVSQYCRFTGEIKRGANVKQMVRRAMQFATSDPKGPVYIYGAREAMEEEIEPYSLRDELWGPVKPATIPPAGLRVILDALERARRPLLIAGYMGRSHEAVREVVRLADRLRSLRVLDTAGSDLCFPASHRSYLGVRYGTHPEISAADVILVVDCDVPWIPTQRRPKADARIFHIDSDPLKRQMGVFYLEAEGRWQADAATVLSDLNDMFAAAGGGGVAMKEDSLPKEKEEERDRSWEELGAEHSKWIASAKSLAAGASAERPDGTISIHHLMSAVRESVPADTIFVIEAVTNTTFVADQLRPDEPGTWYNCGGGGLGWSGAAALGVKLATIQEREQKAKQQGTATAGASSGEISTTTTTKGTEVKPSAEQGRFICHVVGDGTFVFTVPSAVYWLAARYHLPILTIVLNNVGWHAPRRSLLLVHPEGAGSRATPEQLGISFAPSSDYAGIAVAAAGGGERAWGGRASTPAELARRLPEAIRAVREEGRVAVLDAHLDGTEGKYVPAGAG